MKRLDFLKLWGYVKIAVSQEHNFYVKLQTFWFDDALLNTNISQILDVLPSQFTMVPDILFFSQN